MKLNRYFLGALLCAFTVCLSDTVEMSQSLLTSLRAKRDGALKKIAAQKLSANEIGHELLCLLEYAFKRGIQERRVQMGKDPHHFSHFTNVAAIVTAKVAQVMKGNYLYHSLRPEYIGVLDGSRIYFAPFCQLLSPLLMVLNPNEIPPLKKRFPQAKAVLCFDSRATVNRAQLESAVGHELAHVMQPKCSAKERHTCVLLYNEIDADIKNICIQTRDQKWHLRDESLSLVEHTYELMTQEKNYVLNYLMQDLDGAEKGNMETFLDLGLHAYYDTHPMPDERRLYMLEVIDLMSYCDGGMRDTEFRAMIGSIATRHCNTKRIPVNTHFLKLTRT